MLENYIRENPVDLEARYLQIMVQLNVTSFFDYKDAYRNHYALLKKEIGSSSLPQSYQTRILSKIKN
ncbi:hypothetical protein AFM12_01510 [Jiulongibacter sediminis]|uniref:Uncharacterized protein n=1 Tax=Jiulongibacter sediminis TaxID=1605367 RepID=A0A0P7C4R0_9BACT|nr:hypothetical protein AFM12_01510 [Jiulongibacter sediminis]TBX26379.1 hypothetical protein TK44_01515 [Jiulongibacter sediminis]